MVICIWGFNSYSLTQLAPPSIRDSDMYLVSDSTGESHPIPILLFSTLLIDHSVGGAQILTLLRAPPRHVNNVRALWPRINTLEGDEERHNQQA